MNKYIVTNEMKQHMKRYMNNNLNVTYKEICNDFGWDVDFRNRSIKKAQFKTIDTLCRYEKVGKGKGLRYKIIEVYEDVKEREDGRLNGIYTDNIDVVLTYYIHENMNDGVLNLSKINALELAGLINGNFDRCRKDVQLTAVTLGIPVESVSHFINVEYRKSIEVLVRSLSRLSNRGIISYSDTWLVVVDNKDEIIGTEKGGYVYSKKTRATTIEEEKVIYSIRDEMFEELGHKSMKDVYLHGYSKKFLDELNKRLREHLDIHYAYRGFGIIASEYCLKANIERFEAKYNKSELNKKIKEEHMKGYINEKEKAISIGDICSFKFSDFHENDMQTLLDNFVDIKAGESIIKQMDTVFYKKNKNEKVMFERNTYGKTVDII